MYTDLDTHEMCLAPEIYKEIIKNRDRRFRLSSNFTVGELLKTSRKVDNWPTDELHLFRLHNLCRFVLQPVRQHFGRPVKVSSGYRSKKLNKLIGGSKTSQHCRGQAADFEVPGLDNREVAKWLRDNLDHDQLILEFYRESAGKNSGWIHCSYKYSGNRKQFLVAQKNGKKTVYLAASPSRLESL